MNHIKTFNEMNENMDMVIAGGFIASIIGSVLIQQIFKSIGGAIWKRVKLSKEKLHKGLDKIRKEALSKSRETNDRITIMEETIKIREKINNGEIETLGEIYKELK